MILDPNDNRVAVAPARLGHRPQFGISSHERTEVPPSGCSRSSYSR